MGRLIKGKKGFPGGTRGKESASQCRRHKRQDGGLIPGSGRFPGGEKCNSVQYSCLKNPMDREEPGGFQSIGSQRAGH